MSIGEEHALIGVQATADFQRRLRDCRQQSERERRAAVVLEGTEQRINVKQISVVIPKMTVSVVFPIKLYPCEVNVPKKSASSCGARIR